MKEFIETFMQKEFHTFLLEKTLLCNRTKKFKDGNVVSMVVTPSPISPVGRRRL